MRSAHAALLSALFGVIALLGVPPARGAETERELVTRALEDLASPAERVRHEAVRRLVAALPDARDQVAEALETSRPDVRLHLVEVLARDGAPESVRALLGALGQADDLLASRIQLILARDVDATRKVLEAWKADPQLGLDPEGEPAPRMQSLARLLRRAQAETLFLSRKSRTGSTGSYRGQFALLEPYREEALELCVDILLDRAPAVPGVYRVGKFAFLRKPDIPWDIDDVQGMAAHAFSEVARPTDYRALLELTGLLKDLRQHIPDGYRFRVLGGIDSEIAFGHYIDLVVALYRVNPRHYKGSLESLLDLLEESRGDMLAPSRLAAVLLRVGRYEKAIDEYRILHRFGSDPSPALTKYNTACAYAQWGLEQAEPVREEMFQQALRQLRYAVQSQWSDISWLDEDRDLDPIRDRPEFAAIRALMIEQVTPPGADAANGSRPGSGR